jgi:hypothetical protein
MRWLLMSALLGLQTAPLPPAYPRPGATKIFENSRVVVWDIAWLKQQYPLHRHVYDLVGVYYSPGDRVIVSVDGARRPVSTKAWDTAYQNRGVTHIEEGASDEPLRAVFIEMKEDKPRGMPEQTPAGASFPVETAKQLYDNERVLAWELRPGPEPRPHRHGRDTVIIAFTGQTPHVTFVPAGTAHPDDPVGSAEHLYAFELK